MSDSSLIKSKRKEYQKQLRMIFQKESEGLFHLSSMDPLELLSHPYSKELATSYALKWGAGLSPIRENPGFEKKLLETKKTLSTLLLQKNLLLFNYQVDLLPLALGRLLTRRSLLLKQQSIKASPNFPLEVKTFCTKEISHFLKEIPQGKYDKIALVIESISSFDGKAAPLDLIIELAKEYNLLLIVDDTNAFSLLGKNGYGEALPKKGIDLTLCHMGKNFGYYASLIAICPTKHDLAPSLISLLQHEYTLSPFLLGLIDAAFFLIPTLEEKRNHIFHLTNLLANHLETRGFFPHKGHSFVTLSFDDVKEMKHFTHFLNDHGYLVEAETEGKLVRLNLLASHTEGEIKKIRTLLQNYKLPLFSEAL